MLNIKIVGAGCTNCNKLERLTREVVEEEKIEAEFEKVTDYARFADLGILLTPGLVINDQVISSGKVPLKPKLREMILRVL